MEYRIKLRATPPSHSAYVQDDGIVVVEWYELSNDRPYDSASMLLFSLDSQRELAVVLGLPPTTSGIALVDKLGERFGSYFEIRQFADKEKILYEAEVDFDA